MADFAAHEIAMKGFLIHYTTDSTHTVDGPKAGLPSLPSYPIAANDATWKGIRAVSEPNGMDTFDVETQQYRNGDPETPIVVNYATGFLMMKPFTFKAAWSKELYAAMKALESGRTKVRYLFTWPLRSDETTPSRSDGRGYITNVMESGSAPAMLDITIEKCDDTPTFTAGT